MKTPNQFYAEQVGRPDMGWNVELSEHEFTDVVEAIQLDAFKAGAEWAAKQIKLGNSLAANNTGTWLKVNQDFEMLADVILSASSNLKEIPK